VADGFSFFPLSRELCQHLGIHVVPDIVASDQAGYFNVAEYTTGNELHYGLEFCCPCGCGDESWLPLVMQGQPHDQHAWGWDGNKQQPTLTPSIRRTYGCKFHGYLQAGVWTSAGDGAPVSAQVYRGGPNHPIEPTRNLMTDSKPAPTEAASPSPPAPTSAPGSAVSTAPAPPTGSVQTSTLKFIDGVLHQLHLVEEVGKAAIQHWIPVAGASSAASAPAPTSAASADLEARVSSLESRLKSLENPPTATVT
jgi:hypothetical protein